MKKYIKFVPCLLMTVMLLFTGCGDSKTSLSYTYNVETGDEVVISINTADGYSLSTDVPFTISKDKEELSQGTFITAEYYSAYVNSVKSDDSAKIIDEGTKGKCNYVMWNYNDSEYNYVIMIEGTNTGVLLGNNVSEKSAKECFNRMEISIKE